MSCLFSITDTSCIDLLKDTGAGSLQEKRASKTARVAEDGAGAAKGKNTRTGAAKEKEENEKAKKDRAEKGEAAKDEGAKDKAAKGRAAKVQEEKGAGGRKGGSTKKKDDEKVRDMSVGKGKDSKVSGSRKAAGMKVEESVVSNDDIHSRAHARIEKEWETIDLTVEAPVFKSEVVEPSLLAEPSSSRPIVDKDVFLKAGGFGLFSIEHIFTLDTGLLHRTKGECLGDRPFRFRCSALY